MTTLSEIEAAAEALPPEQKQELLLFLAARIRESGVQLPDPRVFSSQQIDSWISEDQADMRRFQEDA